MDIKERFVVTVSREVGSGGRTIAAKLAEELGVHFYDKELLRSLMRRFDLTADAIEEIKGEKKSWLSDFVRFVSPMPAASAIIESDSVYGMEFNPDVTPDDLYKAEVEILRGLADESSCVIAGRSGFHVLKDHPNKVNVFITASKPSRIKRVMAKQGLDEKKAEEVIDKVDTLRENFIKRHTGKSRYDARNYDLSINVDGLTEDQAVKVIMDYLCKTETTSSPGDSA